MIASILSAAIGIAALVLTALGVRADRRRHQRDVAALEKFRADMLAWLDGDRKGTMPK